MPTRINPSEVSCDHLPRNCLECQPGAEQPQICNYSDELNVQHNLATIAISRAELHGRLAVSFAQLQNTIEASIDKFAGRKKAVGRIQ